MDVFFPDDHGAGDIIVEVACEVGGSCNADEPSFKAYLARWMAMTTRLAPFTSASIMPKLEASAKGAAGQCSGGSDGATCGRKWYQSSWDGNKGLGEQMSALSVIQATLVSQTRAPLTKFGGQT
jgi:mannan endo-1,6-alpha-mannosidase